MTTGAPDLHRGAIDVQAKGTLMAASSNDLSAPPQPALEDVRFGRWQRIGGLALIASALLWLAKTGVLLLTGGHSGIIPLFVIPSMALFYLGASALPVPFLRSRPWWTFVVAVPLTLVAAALVAGTVGDVVDRLVPASAHHVLRTEAGSLTVMAVAAAAGLALIRTGRPQR